MPRVMFGDVVESSVHVGGKKWYVIPLTIGFYTIVVGVLVLIPMMATGALPVPHDIMIYKKQPIKVVPVPPAVRRAKGPVAHNPDPVPGPPTASPDGFKPESPTRTDHGNDDGVPGGDPNLPTFVPGPYFVPLPPPPPPPPEPKPIPRVGGDLKPPVRIKNVSPVYPPIAIPARVQGVVVIEATIGANGRVINAKILRSIPLLDAAALDAVRQWEFTPPTLNGERTPVIMTVTVNFTLQ